MAGYLFDILDRRAFDAEKILMYFKLVDAVYEESTRKNQINGLTDLTCVAVFDRKDRDITLSAYDRVVGGLEIAVRDALPFGKDPSRRDVKDFLGA